MGRAARGVFRIISLSASRVVFQAPGRPLRLSAPYQNLSPEGPQTRQEDPRAVGGSAFDKMKVTRWQSIIYENAQAEETIRLSGGMGRK